MSRLETPTGTLELREKLARAQHKQISNRFGIGIGALVIFSMVAILAIATVDWIFELPSVLRALWILLTVASASMGLGYAYNRWIRRYSISSAAVDTENQLAQFGQRLRTTIDYEQADATPAQASASLLESLRLDSLKVAKRVNWEAAIDRRPLTWILVAASSLMFLVGMFLLLFAEFRTAIARSLLLPFEYTTATYSPESSTIRLGESVEVNAVIQGRPVNSANIRYRETGSKLGWNVAELLPSRRDVPIQENQRPILSGPKGSGPKESVRTTKIAGDVSTTLSDLKKDTEFEVLIGSRRLPLGHVTVLQPLTLDQVQVTINPPDYTKLSPWACDLLDVTAPEGSSVDLDFTFNRAVSSIALVPQAAPQAKSSDGTPQRGPNTILQGSESDSPPLNLSENRATGSLRELRKNGFFSIDARAADGITLVDKQLKIRVKPDLKPRVRFVEPKEQLTVAANAQVPMVVEAEDDYGLYKVGVLFQIGSEPMQTLVEEDAQGSAEPLRLATVLLLEKYALTATKAVTYYAFAEDEYFGTRRRTLTPLKFIDILPEELDAQREPSQEAVDGDPLLSELSEDIEELIQRQRQELSQAFQLGQKQDSYEEFAQDLAQSQQEVLDSTNELAKEIEQFGAKEPALSEAGRHMEKAVEKFDDSDVPSAVPSQQEALSNLIRVREEIRKQLEQANGASKSQDRPSERKQQEKPRKPKKQQTDKQERLAQARRQIEELAEREREWSKQVQEFRPKPLPSEVPQEGASGKHETPAPSAAEINATQKQIKSELEGVRKELESIQCAGGGVSQSLDQASDTMQKGADRFNAKDLPEASGNGQRAADQLEALSSHLGAMNSRDFGERLDQAHKSAEQIAEKQKAIAQNMQPSGTDARQDGAGSDQVTSIAQEQDALATEAQMLAELMKSLQRDAGRESGEVQQRLDQANTETPPREIASGMTDAAKSIRSGRDATAKQQAEEVVDQLQKLTKSLEATRKEYSQPQLKELMALEEQLAMLQEEIKQSESQKGAIDDFQEQSKKLESRLNRLASKDKKLAQALKQLESGVLDPDQSQPSTEKMSQPNELKRDAKDFHGWSVLGDYPRLRKVTQALQTRIQEEILESSVMDADPSVPSAYKELVEKYFKALSDDLR
jgi:hypothetical protein